MTFSVSLDRQDKLSLYRQIAEQIKTQISNGRLPANTRLPTVRQLATQLGVTRLTIQNAYSELQADGWVEATVGRGTYVSRSVEPWAVIESVGHCLTPDSVIGDSMQLDQVVGVRSMALAHPDDAHFPVTEFWQSLNDLRPSASDLLGYGTIQGDPQLRVVLSEMLQEEGITAVPEDILVTSGAMQAISLAAQAIARPGDTVLVDQPTFLGTLNVLKAQHLHAISVPFDEEGPQLGPLEALTQQYHPRFYYAIPNFHNPTGICLSAARRRALLELARRYQLLLVEDDIYGKLWYDAPPPPTLKAQDVHDLVFYLSGFSKVLMPGLRVGYMVAPAHWRESLLTLRCATDLCGPALVQRATAHFLRDGGLKRHLRRVNPLYRDRRDALLQALQTYMPQPVRWSCPAGGFSCWVTLPRLFAPGELYRRALAQGLAFTPGEAYSLQATPGEEHFRLCFGKHSTAGIQAGVKLLAQLIREKLPYSLQYNNNAGTNL